MKVKYLFLLVATPLLFIKPVTPAEPITLPEPITVEFSEPVEVMAEPELISLGEFKLTAYCSCSECCDEWANNRPVDEYGNEVVIGGSGEVLKAGYSVAVDTSVIPYGTVLLINGQEYEAMDCGGAIKGNRIDVYFSDHSDALEFGVQYADVIIREDI